MSGVFSPIDRNQAGFPGSPKGQPNALKHRTIDALREQP